jgi:hypothetical protein
LLAIAASSGAVHREWLAHAIAELVESCVTALGLVVAQLIAEAAIGLLMTLTVSVSANRKQFEDDLGYESLAALRQQRRSLASGWVPSLLFGIPGDTITAIASAFCI